MRERGDWVPVPIGSETLVNRKLIHGLNLDGLLGLFTSKETPTDFDAGSLAPFVTWSGVPQQPNTGQVIADHQRGGELIAEHLFSRGYRTLATFLNKDPRRIGAGLRAEGFLKVASGLRCVCHDFAPGPRTHDRWTLDGQIADLVDWLDTLPKPVGIMCHDDYHSWRVLEAAERLGLRVPGDVGIVGWRNDTTFCESTRPTLSSLAIDSRAQGYEACVLLQAMMDGEPAPTEPVTIPPLGVIGRESTGVSVSTNDEINSALVFIRSHLADDIGVADVARHIGVARRTVQKLFTDELGRSPSEEIRRARLERALELLRSTELQMVEIAVEAGFSHISQLSRAVKQSTGLSPSRYRTRFGVPD